MTAEIQLHAFSTKIIDDLINKYVQHLFQALLSNVDLPHVQRIEVPVSGSDQKAQVKLYLPPGDVI